MAPQGAGGIWSFILWSDVWSQPCTHTRFGESALSPTTPASTAATNESTHAAPSLPVRVHAVRSSSGHVESKSCTVGAHRAHGSAPHGTRDGDRMQQSDGTRDAATLPGAWATRARPLGTAESSSCLRAVNGELLASLKRRDCGSFLFILQPYLTPSFFTLGGGVGWCLAIR